MAEGGVAPAEISCAICVDGFVKPKSLPCGHTFCLSCVRRMVLPRQQFLLCPNCRVEIILPDSGKVEDFPTNFELQSIIEENSKRNAKINAADTTNDHLRVNADLENVNQRCVSHGDKCDFFCKSCNIRICNKCLLGDHKPGQQHIIATCSDFAKEQGIELDGLVELFKRLRCKGDHITKDISSAKMSCEKERKKLAEAITLTLGKEKEKLDKAAQCLLSELTEKFEISLAKMDVLVMERENLSIFGQENLVKCNVMTSSLTKKKFPLKTQSIDELFQNADQIEKRIAVLETSCTKNVSSTLSLEFKGNTVDAQFGRLQVPGTPEIINQNNGNHDDPNYVRYTFDDFQDYDDPFEVQDEYDAYDNCANNYVHYEDF